MRNNDKANQKYYPSFSFRLGDLSAALDKRAASESKAAGRPVSHAKIVKWALRSYLEDGDNALPYFEASELIDALHENHRDLVRVGGNLNQLAHLFNIHNHVDDDELAKVHAELRAEFRQLMTTLLELKDALIKRR